MDFVKILENARAAHTSLQYELDMLLVRGVVNEIGILWHTQGDHVKFANWMAKTNRARYLSDAQVVYALEETPGGDVKEYRYHAKFDFFRMDGWRLQSQVQMFVNPIRTVVDPLFSFSGNGSVIHGSYRSDDLEKELEVWKSKQHLVLARFTSEHSESAYIGELGDLPYLHPRRPHKRT